MNIFGKKSKKVIKWIYVGFAVLIAISMVFAYSGGLGF